MFLLQLGKFLKISPEEDYRCSGEGGEHGWKWNSSDAANSNNTLTGKSYIKHTGHIENEGKRAARRF